MEILILILSFSTWIVVALPTGDIRHEHDAANNSTDTNKDLYVIHAMVYQVGIITNKTDDEISNSNITGNQEAITFYQTNGTNIDLSKLPKPLVTNVTAERLVGVAPAPVKGLTWQIAENSQLPWNTLDHLTPQQSGRMLNADNPEKSRPINRVKEFQEFATLNLKSKRSLETSHTLTENILKDHSTPVKMVEGAAVIPQEAKVQSLALPPLLTLNNNFSEIPVPIPNTSVVQYAKVNTLIRSP